MYMYVCSFMQVCVYKFTPMMVFAVIVFHKSVKRIMVHGYVLFAMMGKGLTFELCPLTSPQLTPGQ